MRRWRNRVGWVFMVSFVFVLLGLNVPGLLSQSQIESPNAPRVTFIQLPQGKCVIAPPGLLADKCPSGSLPVMETAVNWIAADGSDFLGSIGYEDNDGDIIKVTFAPDERDKSKEGGGFEKPFGFEPPIPLDQQGKQLLQGSFSFRIFTTVPQDVTLVVTLEDAKKNMSQPKRFSFKAVGAEPVISRIVFPEQIPLGAQQNVKVGFIDREGELNRIEFQLVNFDPKRIADCILPLEPIDVGEQVLGEKEGQLSFTISCKSAQRIKLKATLVDRQGNRSDTSVLKQVNTFEFIAGRQVAPNLYFLDQFGGEGSEVGTFKGPQSVAVDSKGAVYVADTENHRVQRFDPESFKQGVRRPTFVWGNRCLLRTGDGCRDPDGGGPLAPGDGQFDGPTDIAVDAAGNVYVVDSGNHRVQKFDSTGKFLAKWGTQGSNDGQFNVPVGIALDGAGKAAYIVEKQNHRIQKFDVSGPAARPLSKWGAQCNLTVTPPIGRCVDPDADGPLQTGDGQFNEPQSIAVDGTGNIYVSDTGNHRIQKFDGNGKFLNKWGRQGSAPGQFDIPRGLAISKDGNLLVADQNNDRVQEFKPDGGVVKAWGESGSAEGELRLPQDISVDSSGSIYVVELGNSRVQKFGQISPSP